VTTPIQHKIETRKPGSVTVDLRVQRPLDQRRVDALIGEWDPMALGVPTLSAREDGTLICLDGNHRLEVLRQTGQGDKAISCTVYRGLSLEQEAAMFAKLNNTKRLSPLQLFAVAVVQNEPLALACNLIVDRAGLIAERGHKNSFVAVTALMRAYEWDKGNSASAALTTAVAAWGPRREAVVGHLFSGLANVFYRYGEQVNASQLVEKLRRTAQCDPDSIIGRARTNARTRGISVVDAVADIVVNAYNVNRKTNRLPTWEV
jgi:hypothetical protein